MNSQRNSNKIHCDYKNWLLKFGLLQLAGSTIVIGGQKEWMSKIMRYKGMKQVMMVGLTVKALSFLVPVKGDAN